jgi:hypothetical protein
MYTGFDIMFDSHVGDFVIYFFGPNNSLPCVGGFRSRSAATRWAKREMKRQAP